MKDFFSQNNDVVPHIDREYCLLWVYYLSVSLAHTPHTHTGSGILMSQVEFINENMKYFSLYKS